MKHLLLRLRNVKNVDALQHASVLHKGMDAIVKEMRFHVVGECLHQFKPFGATILYLLSESHCSAHTFWEEKEVYIDVFCCFDFNEKKAIELFCAFFQTLDEENTVVVRNV